MKKLSSIVLRLLIVFAVFQCVAALTEWMLSLFYISAGLVDGDYALAPLWFRTLVSMTNNIAVSVGAVASIVAMRFLCGKSSRKQRSFIWLIEAAALGVLIVAALLIDSLRFDRTAIGFTTMQLIPVIYIVLTVLLSEMITKKLLFESIGKRLIAVIVTVTASVLLTASVWTRPLSLITVIPAAIVSCLIYEKSGITGSTLFRVVPELVTSVIIGFPAMYPPTVINQVVSFDRIGLTHAPAFWPVTQVYHVSDAWLTGGSNGMCSSIAWASVLVAMAVFMTIKEIRSKY